MNTTMLGRANSQWEDMSPDVIHITRGANASESYENLLSILDTGCLEARNPFGAARKSCPDPASQRAVCFTEVPVHLVLRIIQRRLPSDRSAWNGIAFRKSFVASRGGGPIMYAYDGSPHAEALEAMMQAAWSTPDPASAPVWRLTPYVDLPGRHGTYYWEWEREWRVVGDLRFEPADVSCLIVPEQYHQDAARHFMDAVGGKSGHKAYLCPLIDATWSLERCRQAMRDRRLPV
ncbi:hypothetical protein ACFPYM_01050 [Methylobacterium hispanicum]|nr:hypothetical protein [Methylobacterium hispanicum]